MIVAKCKMNSIPKSCNKCVYYVSEGKYYSRDNDKVCYADGKGFLVNDIRVTVERSERCPLIDLA